MTVDPSLCAFCAHYNDDDDAGPPACAAFPRGIPEDVWNGFALHLMPFPGQEGELVFEARQDLGAEDARYVMKRLDLG